jgi:hypothetical protein
MPIHRVRDMLTICLSPNWVENFPFPRKRFSLSHHITKENIPTPFFQLPHPTPPKKIFFKKLKKSYLPIFKKTKLFLPMQPKKQRLGLVPIPKKITSRNPI